MKFECEKEDIVSAVVNVQRAISAKPTVTMLEGISFVTGDGKLTLFGTDNEIGIECVIDADVQEAGTLVINSKLIGDIVRNMPDGLMRFVSTDNKKIRISSGETKFDILVIQTDAFPTFPEVDETSSYIIDKFTLKKMLQQTAFAIGTDESRKIMTGLFLESDDKELRTVALDGFRIALRRQPIEPGKVTLSSIIPYKTVSELIKIIPSVPGEMRITSVRNSSVLSFDNCRVFTRLISGEYFNYKYLIPEEYVTMVKTRRSDLLEAVERATVILNADSMRRNPIIFNADNDTISIKTTSDAASSSGLIPVEMEGKPIKVAFNPRFLIDALRAIEDEFITVRFTSSVGQCTIRPVNNDSYVYLILPIKTTT